MARKLKVVVVEDEYYVRKGIINSTNWSALTCEIVGEAENGVAGLEVIRETEPDLVIVDIEMPLMSGLEMVEQLKLENRQLEYLFLTSHQNFSYVYKAIKLDVIDYLLKPFMQADLEKCLAKVKVKLHLVEKDELDLTGDTAYDIEFKNSLIQQAVQYVKQHYKDDISNTSMAEYLNISEAYFCRTFKKETGYTFGQYLSHYRIHIAAKLLRKSDMRINEVALLCGIADSNYFSQIFKKIKGISPKDYQSSQKTL